MPRRTRAQRRARTLRLGFVAVVLVPFALSAAYLYGIAAPQFHSETAFSIRSEETSMAAAGILGAITQISSGTASDADVLYDTIRSQSMVEAIDEKLDLRAIYSIPQNDLLFALPPDASQEDLVEYWGRMVHVVRDAGSGIIRVRAEAFSARDATAIATAILTESTEIVNRLSAQARSDAIRFASADLAEAQLRLKSLRADLARFRRDTRIIDPAADVAGQMGLLGALQTELAQALVDRDTLRSYADDKDHRVVQANRRIEAISTRIDAERLSLGLGVGPDGGTEVLGRYEALLTDFEFAQAAYTQAMTNLALARAEARRQNRYLAPHIRPTLAETALYPRRWLLTALVGLFLMLGWAVIVIVGYNLRDTPRVNE